jgi:glycerol kinase
MHDYVAAIDQGTTSTRFVIFDRGGNEIAKHQLEHAKFSSARGRVSKP